MRKTYSFVLIVVVILSLASCVNTGIVSDSDCLFTDNENICMSEKQFDEIVFSVPENNKFSRVVISVANMSAVEKVAENYYSFKKINDNHVVKGIEFKCIYIAAEENLKDSSLILSERYHSANTFLYEVDFTYDNGDNLISYAMQNNETFSYQQLCYLGFNRNNIICEFVLDLGDLESLRHSNYEKSIIRLFQKVIVE